MGESLSIPKYYKGNLVIQSPNFCPDRDFHNVLIKSEAETSQSTQMFLKHQFSYLQVSYKEEERNQYESP